MTISGSPGETWDEVLRSAREGSDFEQNESRITAILAAALQLSPDSLRSRRIGGFPAGVPQKALVRSAAQLMIAITEEPCTDRSLVRRSIAWTQLLRLPQREVVTDAAPHGEIVQAVENCRRGIADLGVAGDPVDRAIIDVQLARTLRRSGQSAQAVEILVRSAPADLAKSAAISRPLILDDAPFLADFLWAKVAFKTAEILHSAYKDLGLLENSIRQADLARKYARIYADIDPADYANTWLLEGHLHRRRRDVPAMLQSERQSKQLVDEYPDSEAVWRCHSVQVSANASKLQDLTRAMEVRYQRLSRRLFVDLEVEIEGRPTIEALKSYVAEYRRLGSKAGITALGNMSFDLASGYVRAGDVAADPDLKSYAQGLLDVAEEAWDGFASNGVSSLLYGRARLALASGEKPTKQTTADLLTANQNAYRLATAFSALLTAVRRGVPASAAVRERLDSLLAVTDSTTSYVAYAKYLGLSVEWHWRAADLVELDWSYVESEALRATQMLRHEGVSIDPESEAVAWMTAARALAGEGWPTGAEQLRRLLLGIGCVTELMLTIATTVDRQRIARKFARLFGQAAEIAVELGDHHAADLIMEAARRDRVGLLLAELARNPDIDADIRNAALAVQDLGSTTVGSAPICADDRDDVDEDESGVRGRSAVIAADRASAVKAAEAVLGPLSALADPGHLEKAAATAVIACRDNRNFATAVLQFLPLPSDIDATGSSTTVLRRLTIAIPERPIEQFTDFFEVAQLILDLEYGSEEDDRLFTWRSNYTPLLFPEQLMDLLASTPTTDPLRLMIVPTGFFHIPFDALPVTANTHVLDHALVSIHGSLTSVLSLMALEHLPSPTPALAVYDHDLKHATDELNALLTAFSEVRSIDSLQALDTEMAFAGTQLNGLLAMAVHGSSDQSGWGQAKLLRNADGEEVWVTAAQALRWNVPRLCVLASCNTPITAPDGIEVGGFPLALMLRGATTVIGGLYAIDDKATSDIMIAFWKHLAEGESALGSLRNAKLNYLHTNPESRRTWPEYWAGLTVYGAAHL